MSEKWDEGAPAPPEGDDTHIEEMPGRGLRWWDDLGYAVLDDGQHVVVHVFGFD